MKMKGGAAAWILLALFVGIILGIVIITFKCGQETGAAALIKLIVSMGKGCS